MLFTEVIIELLLLKHVNRALHALLVRRLLLWKTKGFSLQSFSCSTDEMETYPCIRTLVFFVPSEQKAFCSFPLSPLL